jgi:hypothetical protein
MARYRFTVVEEQYGYAYFDADSYTQAVELFNLAQEGEIDPQDLPNGEVKIKNGQCEYYELEEIK